MRHLLLLAVLLSCSAHAHEMHHRIDASAAVVVTLNYANGKPFAYEKYALTPAGQEAPAQVGNTDAQGRIVFLPGATRQWHVQVSSADGHGANLEFTAPDTAEGPTTSDETIPRWLLAILGLSIIFGGFGLYQLLLRRPAD